MNFCHLPSYHTIIICHSYKESKVFCDIGNMLVFAFWLKNAFFSLQMLHGCMNTLKTGENFDWPGWLVFSNFGLIWVCCDFCGIGPFNDYYLKRHLLFINELLAFTILPNHFHVLSILNAKCFVTWETRCSMYFDYKMPSFHYSRCCMTTWTLWRLEKILIDQVGIFLNMCYFEFVVTKIELDHLQVSSDMNWDPLVT